MNRLQRNRARRARRRAIAFSLLLCIIIFAAGVYLTNEVMMDTLLLPEEDNIFSFRNMGQTLKDAVQTIEAQGLWEELRNNLENLLKQLLRIAGVLK